MLRCLAGSTLSDMTAMVDDLIAENEQDGDGGSRRNNMEVRQRARTVANDGSLTGPADFKFHRRKTDSDDDVEPGEGAGEGEEDDDDDEAARWRSMSEAVTEKDRGDLIVMLQLQKKLADLSRENRHQRDLNERLRERTGSRSQGLSGHAGLVDTLKTETSYANLKQTELEIANAKLAEQLRQLQQSVCHKEDSANRELMGKLPFGSASVCRCLRLAVNLCAR